MTKRNIILLLKRAYYIDNISLRKDRDYKKV